MKKERQCSRLRSQLFPGKVYQWRHLKKHTNSPGRDLRPLVDEGLLRKVGPGLYLVPQKSRFGELPADERLLVKAFLKSNDFLLFSTNLYNSLGLGLTQLRNETVVYNKKRYSTIVLSGREFCFRRPNNGYPKKLTPEFLLVDLMNHIKLVGESPSVLKQKVSQRVGSGRFNTTLLLTVANKYGKIGTKKFFKEMLHNNNSSDKVA